MTTHPVPGISLLSFDRIEQLARTPTFRWWCCGCRRVEGTRFLYYNVKKIHTFPPITFSTIRLVPCSYNIEMWIQPFPSLVDSCRISPTHAARGDMDKVASMPPRMSWENHATDGVDIYIIYIYTSIIYLVRQNHEEAEGVRITMRFGGTRGISREKFGISERGRAGGQL